MKPTWRTQASPQVSPRPTGLSSTRGGAHIQHLCTSVRPSRPQQHQQQFPSPPSESLLLSAHPRPCVTPTAAAATADAAPSSSPYAVAAAAALTHHQQQQQQQQRGSAWSTGSAPTLAPAPAPAAASVRHEHPLWVDAQPPPATTTSSSRAPLQPRPEPPRSSYRPAPPPPPPLTLTDAPCPGVTNTYMYVCDTGPAASLQPPRGHSTIMRSGRPSLTKTRPARPRPLSQGAGRCCPWLASERSPKALALAAAAAVLLVDAGCVRVPTVLQPGAVPLESLSYTRQVALLSSELDRARLEAANHRVTAAEAAANAAMLSRRIREQTLSSVVQGQRIDAVVGTLAQALTAAAAGVGGGAGGGGPPPFLLLCCAAPAPPSARKSRARPAEAPAAAATAAGMGCRTSRRPPLCSSVP